MDRIVCRDNASYFVPRTVHEKTTCTPVIVLVHLPPTSKSKLLYIAWFTVGKTLVILLTTDL